MLKVKVLGLSFLLLVFSACVDPKPKPNANELRNYLFQIYLVGSVYRPLNRHVY